MDWAAISGISGAVAALAASVTMIIAGVSAYVAWQQLFPPPLLTLQKGSPERDPLGWRRFNMSIDNRTNNPVTIFDVRSSAQNWATIKIADVQYQFGTDYDIAPLDWKLDAHASKSLDVLITAREGELGDFALILRWSSLGNAGRPKRRTYRFKA